MEVFTLLLPSEFLFLQEQRITISKAKTMATNHTCILHTKNPLKFQCNFPQKNVDIIHILIQLKNLNPI